MLEITSRQRPITLLAVVVTAQILLLAFQVKREHDVRLVRFWAVALLTPVQRAGSWVISGTRGNWQHYIGLRHASEENDHLRSELGRLQLRNRELESRAAEAQRLAVLLNFREAHPEAPMLPAQVIGANADALGRTIFINRGERDHLRRNLAVVTPDGVVGKIVDVYAGTSQVLLLTDRESGVGALFGETRTHGVVKGTSEPLVRMEYVINEEKVHPGEEVLTSGEDRIFPKDLPIGTVESNKPGNPFQQIRVKPAARLDRLEEVLVLLTSQELNPRKDAEAFTAGSGGANKPPLPQR
jgi:rod shape-determining protein MreC